MTSDRPGPPSDAPPGGGSDGLDPPPRPVRGRAGRARGPLRALLFACGVLLTGLAAAGAFLPVLPTTPFLLVAAACFVRSSPSLHRRLLANRVFGPYLVQWQHDHTVPRDAKRKAYGLVVATFALSIAVVDGRGLRLLLVALGCALLAFLAWLPTTPRVDRTSRAESDGPDAPG